MTTNIAIITPFYPIKHRNDLFEDTKAVHYLIKEFPEQTNTLIIHTFMHGFRHAWKKVKELVPLSGEYEDYLHRDDYNNQVLFFEYPLLLPKSLKVPSYLNKKYARRVMDFYDDSGNQPDVAVIHFPTYYVEFLKQLNPIIPKSIAIIHSFDIKNIKKRMDIGFWNDFFSNFDSIGFRSYPIKKEFENYLGKKKNTFMCLSGIPEQYLNSEINDSVYPMSKHINLLYAGRLDQNKNVEKTINVLNRIKTEVAFKFTVVGDGVERKRLEQLALDFNLREEINFTGSVSRDKTFELMKYSDIFIMISKKETLGLVYLEAMSAGCIVIGTRGQGIDGIVINGENGFLTSSSDEEEIYETIKYVMTLSGEEQKRIRKNAKDTVSSLSDRAVSKTYYSNICSVIQGEAVNE